MIVLGIETSCDETAVAVVRDGVELLANVVLSSMDLHVAYGGVVPEIAARSHVEAMIPVVEMALGEAFGSVAESSRSSATGATSCVAAWEQIDAIAVTYGGGLGGSLLVGVMTARTLAIVHDKPLYAVNHVEGHVYANFLTRRAVGAEVASEVETKPYLFPANQPAFPILALIVSGKHSQLALFFDHFDYVLLGQTYDDAVGEAFDKVAKLLGLPYPGGPSVEKAAAQGDPYKYRLPKARMEGENEVLQALRRKASSGIGHAGLPADTAQRPVLRSPPNYDFSFSGLKTAVLRLAQKEIGEDFTFPSFKLSERLTDTQKYDIAASFRRVAVESLVDKTVLAAEEFKPASVVIAGGVGASKELRRQLSDRLPIHIEYPDMKLCTDNGAMIATLGCYKAMLGQEAADPYRLTIAPNLTMVSSL